MSHTIWRPMKGTTWAELRKWKAAQELEGCKPSTDGFFHVELEARHYEELERDLESRLALKTIAGEPGAEDSMRVAGLFVTKAPWRPFTEKVEQFDLGPYVVTIFERECEGSYARPGIIKLVAWSASTKTPGSPEYGCAIEWLVPGEPQTMTREEALKLSREDAVKTMNEVIEKAYDDADPTDAANNDRRTEPMKTIVIYHGNCYDGLTAAWCARRVHPDAEFVAANYGEDPPDVTGAHVFVVDFSYPRDVLLQMRDKAASIKVLDHHKTAQEALADLDFATFDMERSGAGLAWDYFVGGPRPPIVEHVEDRDLWRFSLARTKDFHAAMTSWPMTFESWDQIAAMHPDDVRNEGIAIRRMIENTARKFAERAGTITLAGVQFWVTNVPVEFTSEVGEVLRQREPKRPVCNWSADMETGETYCSLRSDSEGPDVSEIAKKFGGGGHRNAAGFRFVGSYQIPAPPGLRGWKSARHWGRDNATQDAMENAPFASVGGLEARRLPLVAPEYVPREHQAEWIAGYMEACVSMYGYEWLTVGFSWSPAMVVGG